MLFKILSRGTFSLKGTMNEITQNDTLNYKVKYLDVWKLESLYLFIKK